MTPLDIVSRTSRYVPFPLYNEALISIILHFFSRREVNRTIAVKLLIKQVIKPTGSKKEWHLCNCLNSYGFVDISSLSHVMLLLSEMFTCHSTPWHIPNSDDRFWHYRMHTFPHSTVICQNACCYSWFFCACRKASSKGKKNISSV